mmetsp:Transcript_10874/g.14547  ORF Transcript_10874/g.14547 Transcript_10874/m.14547 type:complete len:203 (+) Transcript_10874:52-660(+)
MENLIGIAFESHIVLAASAQETFHYIQLHNEADKLFPIDENKILAVAGTNAHRTNLVEYIHRNLELTKLRAHGVKKSTHATAHFIRGELASALRSEEGPYECFLILAGCESGGKSDGSPKSSLYFLDYLGTIQKVPYCCHGYGATFATAILDRYYRRDMTVEESLELLKKCMDEIRQRIIINNEKFVVKVLKEGGLDSVESY